MYNKKAKPEDYLLKLYISRPQLETLFAELDRFVNLGDEFQEIVLKKSNSVILILAFQNYPKLKLKIKVELAKVLSILKIDKLIKTF